MTDACVVLKRKFVCPPRCCPLKEEHDAVIGFFG